MKGSPDQNIYAFRSGSFLRVYRNPVTKLVHKAGLSFDSTNYPKFDFALAGSRIAIAIACDTLLVRIEEIRINDVHLPDYDPLAKEALCDISDNGCIVAALVVMERLVSGLSIHAA